MESKTWTTNGNREIETTVSTVRYIFRCTKCKTARRVDYTRTETAQYVNGIPVVKPTVSYSVSGQTRNLLRDCYCQECGRACEGRAVQAILNPDHKCDARCLEATGHKCECSCGGENHGAAHLVA